MEGETMTSEVEQLFVVVEEGDDEVVLFLDGELDPHTAPRLEREIGLRTSAPAGTRIVLDLTSLRFIDSSGLRVVIGAHRQLQDAGLRLVLRNPSTTAMRLLEITGLTSHLEVEDGGAPA
jgi:anti-anti-sigma factor